MMFVNYFRMGHTQKQEKCGKATGTSNTQTVQATDHGSR